MLHKMILRMFFVLALLSGAAEARSQQLEADIVYESPELLTKSMLRKHAQFIQDLMGIEYTSGQTAKHYRIIKDLWLRHDYTGIRSVQAHVAYYDELKKLSPEEYKNALANLRQSMLQDLAEDAALREDARWYLENYQLKYPAVAGVRK